MRRQALVFLLLLVPSVARAQQDEPPKREMQEWRPRRELRIGTTDLVVIGAAGGVALGAAIVSPHSKHAYGGVLFDEDARDALRARSQETRYAFRDMSDVGVSISSTWPFLIDALVTAWWYRGYERLARDMAIVDAE